MIQNLKKTEKQANALSGTFKRAFIGLGAGLSLAKIIGDMKQTIYRMDEMADAAGRLGITSEAFSELAYSAKIFDVEMGQLAQSLKFMQVNMAEAANGSDSAGAAFSALGINIKELISLPANEQFYRIVEGLGGIENAAQRTAIAQQIFGRSSQGVLDLVNQVVDTLKRCW